MPVLEQALVIRVSTDGTATVSKLASDVRALGASAKEAGAQTASGFASVRNELGNLASSAKGAFSGLFDVMENLKAAVVGLGIGEALRVTFEAFKEVAGAGDHIRDMTAALGGVIGSAEGAAKALKFFEDAQKSTRATSDELVKTYTQLLPQALRAGFGKEQFQDIVVQLSQFATATGHSFQEIQEAYQQLLSGVARRGTNPILSAMGLGPEQVFAGAAGAARLQEGLKRIAAQGREMGDSFESAMGKIKNAWQTALGQGFNSALGSATGGIDGLKTAMTDPGLIDSIKRIGEEFAKLLPTVAKIAGLIIGAVNKITFSGKTGEEQDYERQGRADQKVIDYYRSARQQIAVGAQGPGIYDTRERFAAANQAGIYEQLHQAQLAVGKGGEEAAAGIDKTADAANKGAIDLSHFGEKVGIAVQGLLGLDEASRISTAALFAAFGSIQKQFGDAQAFRAFGDQLVSLGVKAGDLHLKLTPLQQAEVDQAKALATARDAAIAYGAALKSQMDAVDQLAGAQPDLDKQLTTLSAAFETLNARGVKMPDVAEALGPEVTKVQALLVKLGLTMADLPPQAQEAFGAIRDQIVQSDALAMKFQEDMAGVANKLKDDFSNIFKNAESGIGGTNFSQVAQQLEAAAASAARSFAEVYAAAIADPGISDTQREQFKKAYESAVKDNQINLNASFREAMDKSAAALKQAIDDLGTQVGNIFSDLATTGGKNFAQTAAQGFLTDVQKGSKILTNLFSNAVLQAFGSKPTQQAGESNADFAKRQLAADQQNKAIIGTISGVIGLVGQTIQEFKDAKSGKDVSVVGSTVAGAAAGASIGSLFPGLGTIIGALAGAIVGAITSILANQAAKKALPYASFGIRGGEAFVEPAAGEEAHFANITAKQYSDMIQQLNSVFEETSSAYVKILLKFPLKVVAMMGDLSLANLNFAPTVQATQMVTDKWKLFWGALTGGIWGAIFNSFQVPKKPVGVGTGELPAPEAKGPTGLTGLKTFQDDFTNWVNNTLPQKIAEEFKGRVQASFVAMGMTADRFSEIWGKLQGMDPKAAEQVLSDTADALIAFDKFQEIAKGLKGQFDLEFTRGGGSAYVNLPTKNAATPGVVSSGGGFEHIDPQTGLLQQRGISDFHQMLIDSQEELAKEAIAIAALPFDQSAAAAAQLGQNLLTLQGKLIDFLNHVKDVSQSISESIAAQKFQISMDQASIQGPQAQNDLLLAKLKADELLMHSAGLSPEDVQKYAQAAANDIQQLYALDKPGRAAWAQAELDSLDKQQKAILKAIGDAAISQFQLIADAMTPVIDFFKNVQDPVQNLGTSADDAHKALDDLANSAKHLNTDWQPPNKNREPNSLVTTQTTNADTTTTGKTYGIPPAGADTYVAPPPQANTYTPVLPSNTSTFGGGSAAPNPQAALAVQQSFEKILNQMTASDDKFQGKLDSLAATVNTRADSGAQGQASLLAMLQRIALLQEQANQILAAGHYVQVGGDLNVVIDDQTVAQVPLDDGFDRRVQLSRGRRG